MKILVLNAGSSTQKSCLYEVRAGTPLSGEPPAPLWEAQIVGSGSLSPIELSVRAAGQATQRTLDEATSSRALEAMLETLWSGPSRVIDGPEAVDTIGHRIVHGGREFQRSTLVTPEVKAAIDRCAPLAPAHNPAGLSGIEVAESLFPGRPQFAVFDTAFHHTIADEAAIYPGPYAWAEQGIRRYGFHGINHQYCAGRAAELLGREPGSLRLISCHLGNGCSLAAIRGGRSIDTTMGFTPLEGLMMGTRSGTIDPGILIYLMREQGYGREELERVLEKESGLKGLSGISGDMRDIRAAIERGDKRAKLAYDIYVHRICVGIGAMLVSLGGLDALVFTAGVGENHPALRADVCARLRFLGVEIDSRRNEDLRADCDVAAGSSPVFILVLRAQEDWAIARECWAILENNDTQ